MKFQERGGKGEVSLAGNLTLARSLALKEELERALEESRVEVFFGEVESVDLAFLQVLCAARRTALRDGKEIAFREETVPREVSELVRDVGFHKGAGSEEDLFWEALSGRGERE